MGVLIVHCPNRPEDEFIDCGIYGLRLNMHSHSVSTIKGELIVGTPVPGNKKLPAAGHENTEEKIAATRAQSAGAVIDTESPGGIHSTDLPGGVVVDTQKTTLADTSKSAPVKSGGE